MREERRAPQIAILDDVFYIRIYVSMHVNKYGYTDVDEDKYVYISVSVYVQVYV